MEGVLHGMEGRGREKKWDGGETEGVKDCMGRLLNGMGCMRRERMGCSRRLCEEAAEWDGMNGKEAKMGWEG